MMENKTVLVVEDNDLNMKLIRTLLQVGDYRVLCAENAVSGIHLATENKPDLIFMDIQLPDMDGLSATRNLKNNPKTRDIPIVALTAYAMEKDKKLAIAAGCLDHMTKPIDTKNFLSFVSQYISGGKREACWSDQMGEPHIMIVDDEPMNLKLLDMMLKQEGFQTETAGNGSRALEMALMHPPDLILLDVMMPGINGFELTKKLKDNPKTSNIPIVMVTALDSAEDKARGMAAGADEFLNKPVNRTELIARVRSLLKLKVYNEQLTNRIKSKNEIIKPVQKTAFDQRQDNGVNILLVEDCQKDADLFKLYLSNQEYRIFTAETGEKALNICQQNAVDLVLLDLVLPGLDGFDICRRLKKTDRTKNIQILMVSSQNDLDSKLKALDLGVDEFLVKPLDRAELLVRVTALLRKKRYIDGLVNQLEIALSASIIDDLTELYNCAYLKHFMDLEIKRCDRKNQKMAFVMIDIDDFKQYNDTYGHPAGDILLKQFGRLIKKTIRDIDLAARYGGEEFGIVLPYTSKENAHAAMVRLLKQLQSYSLSDEITRLCERKTASMGIACYPEDGRTVADIIKRADEAMYQAKRQGKNRISLC